MCIVDITDKIEYLTTVNVGIDMLLLAGVERRRYIIDVTCMASWRYGTVVANFIGLKAILSNGVFTLPNSDSYTISYGNGSQIIRRTVSTELTPMPIGIPILIPMATVLNLALI